MRAVGEHFTGTTAERLVLMLFAMHADKDTGVTHFSCTIDTVARLAGMDRSNVRRIVRKYERAMDGDRTDGWLYVVSRQAKQGDVHGTIYRMPLKPKTTPLVKRAPRNPKGINRGLQKPPIPGVTITRVSAEKRGLHKPPAEVPETPHGGYGNLQTGVTQTHSSREALEARLPTASTADSYSEEGTAAEVVGYSTYHRDTRQAGGDPLPLGEWLKQGLTPPHPQEGMPGEAAGESRDHNPLKLPPGAREQTLAEFIEPTVITGLQDEHHG
jgi:hypothetical protein